MISALFVFCMRWGRVSIMQVVPHCSCIQSLSLQKWTPAFYSSYVQCHMKKLRCGHSNKNKKCTHILTRNEDQLVRTRVTANPQRGKKHCGSGRLGKWSHISYQEAESWRQIRKKMDVDVKRKNRTRWTQIEGYHQTWAIFFYISLSISTYNFN